MSQETVTVQLDDEQLNFDGTSSFASVSDQLKTKVAPNRVVTEVFVDERSLNIEEEEEIQSNTLRDLGSIRFCTREVSALLKDSLQLAPQVCEALYLDCDDIESFFDKSDFGAANERIAELSSLVDWMLQMVASLQSYGDGDFRQMPVGESTVIESVRKMDAILSQMYGFLQSQDFDSFRKLLKAEFKPELKVWQEIFTKASTHWTPRASTRES